MPVLADIEMARRIILPALQEYGDRSLKLQGLLRSDAPIRDVRVDDFDYPNGVLLRAGSFHHLFAADTAVARHLLQELNWHWTTPLAFAGIAEEFLGLIGNFADVEWSQPCDQYHLPHEVNLTPFRSQLAGVDALGRPGPEHVDLILAHWPFGSSSNPEDRDYVARRLSRAPASGFFVGDEMVSWALTGDDLSMVMMHTLEDHRRRGIARLVTADLTLQMCDQHVTPYCYVVSGNDSPLGLLEQMGYVRSEGRYCWLGTKPRGRQL
jgi:GNAT superfamily N-acetyltransferase